MAKIVLDAGHGISTPGKRSPADEREWTFNDRVAVACENKLNTYTNVEVMRVDDRTGATDVSLDNRVESANNWNADCYISIHHNALNGVWGNHSGTETYTYNGSLPGSEALASEVHSHILSTYGLTDRGIKKGDFQVLRETSMDAILIEGGFMDSTIDIEVLRNIEQMIKVGESLAMGIAAHLGLSENAVEPEPTTIKYRVKALGDNDYLPWVISTNDYAGIIGKKIDAIQIEGDITYQVYTAGKWLSWVTGYNTSDSNGYAGIHGKSIDCIRIKNRTYRVSPVNDDYLPWVTHYNTIDSNGYAGIKGDPFDRLQIQ
ncbi:MAG: N-acetylmuramoyl-L-alanine amidase [Nitrosopumilales archaeon]|nr:MAG: N-acetylmuramoyl-L-alanine amidase [Nitrosopumilales archaeon]RPJ31544.1 MAG: N-acetylmuramoyl-L-alanine amidase [Nitrosopumilales archaeon]RPJ32812.1 MAG: N-acetylmuramoyl-L-alanine amidase [Nitrosopumilales archaeon]